MNYLRFLTAGESHGPALNIIVEGMPSGVSITHEDIQIQLKRRQHGYGRGARMKIETDEVQICGGIRHGQTMGSPVSMQIINKDHAKWTDVMSVDPLSSETLADENIQAELTAKYLTRVRPGHADFAGAIKYRYDDVRNVLERSSARETTSRVAAGAIARQLLKQLNIQVYSQVLRVGSVGADPKYYGHINASQYETLDKSPIRCADRDATEKIITAIDQARKDGETLGGIVEIIVTGLPIGIGSHVHWDRRLDGILAQALMSVHTVKAVGFGIGELVGTHSGPQVHDQIQVADSPSQTSHYTHLTNRAGGIEGGMSNGENIIIRAALKPIPTLARTPENSLKSIDLETRSNDVAFYERSDVCVVPAGAVVCEAMICLSIADQVLQKFGGDSLIELQDNFERYLAYCQNR